jgi:hypothetical protein
MTVSTSIGGILNWPQRNSISVTLQRLEQKLRHAPEVLTNREQGVLYQYTGHVSPETLVLMEREIDEALAEIASLADRLGLEKWSESNRAILLGELSVLWADLHDMRVDKLKRFGDVSPELNEILTPVLSSLIRHVESMIQLVNEDKGNAHLEP